MTDAHAPIEYISVQDFATTLHRLIEVIERAGMRIFARIDHAAGAREIGEDMPPTVLVLYGHPKGGTPIMRRTPWAALDLPLRVLVYVGAEGSTHVVYHPIAPILKDANVPEALVHRLDAAEQVLHQALVPA